MQQNCPFQVGVSLINLFAEPFHERLSNKLKIFQWHKFFHWLPSIEPFLPTAWNSWENVNFLVFILSIVWYPTRVLFFFLEKTHPCQAIYMSTKLHKSFLLEPSCHPFRYNDKNTVRISKEDHRSGEEIQETLQHLQLTISTDLSKMSMTHFIGSSSSKRHCLVVFLN